VGDDGDGKTLSLCVKRANTTDPETGTIYKGVCSNFLCDLAPGQTLPITGPVGKTFLLPETDNINLIMIATGTGIAPFRGFLHQRFKQNRTQQGENWLFFGAQVQDDFLYEAELKTYEAKHGLHLVTAFSREETNDQGGRMYVQHRIQAHANQMIQLLKQPNTYVYICGLRGMESGINEGLLQAAQYQGTDWDSLLLQLKTEKRWHLEVY
jgi:ferredoxin--NADP+ reductase